MRMRSHTLNMIEWEEVTQEQAMQAQAVVLVACWSTKQTRRRYQRQSKSLSHEQRER